MEFKHRVDEHSWAIGPEIPETVIAFDEAYVQGLYEQATLAISEPIRLGSWCDGRSTSAIMI